MWIICNQNLCTGCGLCVFNCPKKCIKLKEGHLGHLFPEIDFTLCVNCGVCRNVCPSNIKEKEVNYPQSCYAVWAKDIEEYKTSTSGGVSSVFAKYVIDAGGVVYGCAMLPDINVKHIRIDKINDLYKIKGSKYVQSSIIDCLPLLRKDVHEGLLTLFLGTPCQIAAVRRLFKHVPDNLLLVDLICHGVPSKKFLREHVIRKVGEEGTIKNVSFRNTDSKYVLDIMNSSSIIYSSSLWRKRYSDLYYNAFFDGFIFRDCCYICKYANSKRISDITIGDFWGLKECKSNKILPEHPWGCSVVLPVTLKGISFFNIVKDNLYYYEREIEEAIQGNSQLRAPFHLNWRIAIFRFVQKFINMPYIYYLLVLDKIILYKWRKKKKR